MRQHLIILSAATLLGCTARPLGPGEGEGPLGGTGNMGTTGSTGSSSSALITSNDCDEARGYRLSQHAGSNPGQPGLIVVGIYEPISNEWLDTDPPKLSPEVPGDFHLKIDRPGRQVVVVGAYDATNWKIEAGPETEIVQVYVSGYHDVTVSAPPGVPTAGVAPGPYYPGGYDWTQPEAQTYVSELEQHLGIELTVFAGCYVMSELTVGSGSR